MADEKPDSPNPPEPASEEALPLKNLAEKRYVAGKLKSALKYAKRANRLNPSLDGVPEMLTAFKIILTASKTSRFAPVDGTILSTSTSAPAPPDYYNILQVERFANINTIKKQYKKLALTLHPDKNSFAASEEAFKHVGEAFRVLSDRIRRKEYDMRVRIAMQSEAEAAAGVGSDIGELETFWTACSTCRLLHKFERKYLAHNLVCPTCKKSFKAVEVDEEKDKVDEKVKGERVEQGEKVATRVSERIRARKGGKISSVGEILKRSMGNGKGIRSVSVNKGLRVKSLEKDLGDESARGSLGSSGGDGVIEGLRSRSRGKEERHGGEEVMTRMRAKRAKRAKVGEEDMMTLAQMQVLAKKKVSEERMKLKGKEKGKGNENEKEKNVETVGEKEMEMGEGEEMEKGEEMENDKLKEKEMEMDKERENTKDVDMGNVNERKKRPRRGVLKADYVEFFGRRSSKINRDSRLNMQKKSRRDNLDIVAVEELHFYDFDEDRLERSFKKGQVWATYDSEDGMPRHYALIDEVASVNPFEVRLSWLEFQSNGDVQLINWENMGFHLSCGRFKVSERTSVKSLKMFSHVADFERAAREVYWIYPKKGSVWALYNKNMLSSEGRVLKDRYCYDIVIFLTSYCKIHGMSVAYLQKVDGFRTVFKRREIGAHAIRWLEKDDFRLFSHQILAKKLSGEEASSLPKDCWRLDPSSLPPEPLTIGWVR